MRSNIAETRFLLHYATTTVANVDGGCENPFLACDWLSLPQRGSGELAERGLSYGQFGAQTSRLVHQK